MLVVVLWFILNEILKEIHRVFFFLLSSNSVTLVIVIPLTLCPAFMRWCGCAWLCVACGGACGGALGVAMRET